MFIRIFTVSIIMFFVADNTFALKGEEVVEGFKKRMIDIETMKGVISISLSAGRSYKGVFRYQNPGQIYIKFNKPRGKIIVSNGKKLFIYDSASNVCGIQELEKNSESGIIGYIDSYIPILISRTKSVIILKLKIKQDVHESRIESKNNDDNSYEEDKDEIYPDITLTLDSSFLLKEAFFENAQGEGFVVSLSGIKTGEKIVPGFFNFNVPSTAQIQKNPLDIR
ncbi:MAG: outer membrane lipoprotein carrier protein LolA [Spirochaetota bacterium]|nr:outer membrane lipoprotein carrier protein LolA [Spirochaetota bacterium]